MKKIITKYLNNTISKDEFEALETWVRDSEANRKTFEDEIIASNKKVIDNFDPALGFERFTEAIDKKREVVKLVGQKQVLKYAAVVVLMLSLSLLVRSLLVESSLDNESEIVEALSPSKIDPNAIVIKLSDGTTQVITPKENARIKDKAGAIIAQSDGSTLRFDTTQTSEAELVYNDIYVPKGKRLKLILSDASQVWLNSDSHFKFPQHFLISESSRSVSLEGEAFFEVSENKDQPFIVNAGKLDVKVLGTQFNVSAYSNDDHIETTLVEGAVAVSVKDVTEGSERLVPNEQMRYELRTGDRSIRKVDTSIYTAWIDGTFVINSFRFDEILKHLERRDDITIVNNATRLNSEVFKGVFHDETVETILKSMSRSVPFQYSRNGNTITITLK